MNKITYPIKVVSGSNSLTLLESYVAYIQLIYAGLYIS